MTNTTSIPTPRRPRRMAREPKPIVADTATPDTAASVHKTKVKAPSKLDQVEALLLRDTGASIAEMVEATGWQQHSVRGAMAGALKTKRGLAIASEKIDGVRRYHAERAS